LKCNTVFRSYKAASTEAAFLFYTCCRMQREPVTKARRQLVAYLEQARLERKMDHEALAIESGIDPTTISGILSGDGDATLDQWLSLCLALDVDINLNASHGENNTDDLPEVMLCEEPVGDSDIYLLHTRSPQSLWHCELIEDEDDEESSEEENGLLDFRTWDGYEEQWRIHAIALYEGASDDELEKAGDRCGKYLRAYLSWEDEEMRKSNPDGIL